MTHKELSSLLKVHRDTVKRLEEDYKAEIVEFYVLFLKLREKKEKLAKKIKQVGRKKIKIEIE